MSRSLGLASAAAAALVAAAIIVRVANPFGAPTAGVSDVVPLLWGSGAILVLLLTQGWAPTLGWSADVVGASAAASAIIGIAHQVRLENGDRAVLLLDALLVVALMVPLLVAAGYATAGERRTRLLTLVAWATVGAFAAAFTLNAARRTLGLSTGGLPMWLWLAAIAALAGVGLARDLAPAFVRTRVRVRAGEAGTYRTGGALSVLRVFVDELVPGREAGRAEAVETERGRLAADLHAEVLPSLRRALAAAEAGGTVERLAADLQRAVDEVESLLVARRSIVLEEIGLLAGVEWLAERVEERSDVRVEIEVAGGPGPSPDPTGAPGAGGMAARPPRDVERAAFRVAQLALDNVARHAPGATARVTVSVEPADVRLEITDDYDGPPVDEAAAARSGRRGIADMRAEANACHAALAVGRGPGDRGTSIRFRWPA